MSLRYILSRVGGTHEAEDITSQTFMAAYESLRRYRERGQFSAWLFRIARSKLNDHFRRQRREVGLEAAGEVLDMENKDPALLFTQLCQNGYPHGVVKVTIEELSVLLENGRRKEMLS